MAPLNFPFLTRKQSKKAAKEKPSPEVKNTPEYYTSYKPITVSLFHKILEEGDYSLLYKNEKGEKDLSEVWYTIYDEYCRAAKVDNSTIKQIGIVERLKEKHSRISLLLDLLLDEIPEVRNAARDALKSKGYILRENQLFPEEYERLQNQLNVLRTKINIEEKKLPKEQKKEAISLMKQAVKLKTFFPGHHIDIYTMTMEEWLAYWELANEIAVTHKSQTQQNKSK